MYEIGFASQDKNRLVAGAMMLHSVGIVMGDGLVIMDKGKPGHGLHKNLLNSSFKSIHVEGGRAYSGSGALPSGKYSVGFFNLDDPAGFSVFAGIMGERVSKVRITSWPLRNTEGTCSYTATARDGRIVVGCTVTSHEVIGEMIRAIDRVAGVDRWDLRDEYRDRCGFTAIAEPASKRLRITRGDTIVSLDQLKEMFEATA